MIEAFMSKQAIQESEYPVNFIPKDGKAFIGIDMADGADTTVRGFVLDGIWHVQEESYKVAAL
jgi:hypothetical protein